MRVLLLSAPCAHSGQFETPAALAFSVCFSYPTRLIDVRRRYRAVALTDQYAARAVVDRLCAAGIAVRVQHMSAATTTAAYTELRARPYAGTLLRRSRSRCSSRRAWGSPVMRDCAPAATRCSAGFSLVTSRRQASRRAMDY